MLPQMPCSPLAAPVLVFRDAPGKTCAPPCFLASNFLIASALSDASRSGQERFPSTDRSCRRCAFIVEIALLGPGPSAAPVGNELTEGAVAAPIDLPLAGCSATTSVICRGLDFSPNLAREAALALAPEDPRGPLSGQPWHTLHVVLVHSLAPMPVLSIWKHKPRLSSPSNHFLRAA